MRGDPPSDRDLAEAFAAESRRLVMALEAGDTAGALKSVAERGQLLEALRGRGDLDVVSSALVADGHRNGERALALTGDTVAAIRNELESIGKGRSGVNAYRPAGSDGGTCDVSR